MDDFIIPVEKIIAPKTRKQKSLNTIHSGYVDTDSTDYPYYIKKRTLCYNFANMGQLFSIINQIGKPTGKYKSSQDETNGADWVTYDTYDEALHALVNKPTEVVSFDKNDITIQDYNESGNAVEYDVTGDFLDVGRYLDGVPETFGSTKMGNYRGVRVKMFVSGSFSASTDKAIIDERSKRICRLVDWLENQGIRVGINTVYSNDNGHIDIKVKDFGEPLNIYDVGVSSNSDFFRRAIFRLKEESPTISYGYGNSYEFADYMTGRYKMWADKQNLDELVLFINSRFLGDVEEINRRFDRTETYIKLLLETQGYKQYLIDSDINDMKIEQLKGGVM